PVPEPPTFKTNTKSAPSARKTENGRRRSGPPGQPRLTNWPARTPAAISGARMPTTKVPRATWRLPVTGASNAYRVGPRRAPFVDGSYLELIWRGNRGLEQRRGGVQRREARDAALDGGATDLKSILEHGV